MSKKRFELYPLTFVSEDGDGNYFAILSTNYGLLAYDTETKKFELDHVEISTDDYELDNVYKEINKNIKKLIAFYH